jgi:hypothetical protein
MEEPIDYLITSPEPHGLSQDVIHNLSAMGYQFTMRGATEYFGEANAILVDPSTGMLTGGRDPRGVFRFFSLNVLSILHYIPIYIYIVGINGQDAYHKGRFLYTA